MPAVPEGHYVDVGDGHRIHYHDVGAGRPLLWFHGSGPGASGWSNFRRNYPAFAEAGFRCVVPDTLGYGYSSKPDDVEYTLDFLAAKVRRFTDALGIDRCAIVGNSHGGALAIQYALNHPETVSELVLMAPGGLEVRERYLEMRGIRTMMKIFMAEGGITPDNIRKIFQLQLFDPTLVTDDIVAERYEIALTQPKKVLTSMVVPHLAPRLPELQARVYGLWGLDDQFTPVSGAQTIASSCPGSKVMTINQCGHWVMVEHAKLFNRTCLDFLRGEW